MAAVLAVVFLTSLLANAVPAAVRPPPRRAAPGPAAQTALAPSAPLTGTPFEGTPAVGALFTMTGGRLGRHFCTASVIDSPTRDLLVTAAHCVSRYPDTNPAGLAFVPGYVNGSARYGIWTITRIFADSAWRAAADPITMWLSWRLRRPAARPGSRTSRVPSGWVSASHRPAWSA